MILTYELNRSVSACLRQLPVSINLRRRKKHFVWELCFWNKKSSMLQNATTMISPPKLWRVTLCKVPPWYRGHCRDLPPQPYRCLGGLPSLQQKLICSSGVLAGPANMTADTHEGACQKKKILSFSRKPNRRNARDGWISVQDWLCSDLPLWEANCVIWMQKQYFHSYRFHEAAPEHRGSLWPVNPLPGLLAPTYPMRRSIIGSHSLSLVPIQDDTICDSLFTLQ